MPLKRKIVTFAKSEINDSVYEVQNRFFDFLKRKGLVEYESIRGGNVYGSHFRIHFRPFRRTPTDAGGLYAYDCRPFLDRNWLVI